MSNARVYTVFRDVYAYTKMRVRSIHAFIHVCVHTNILRWRCLSASMLCVGNSAFDDFLTIYECVCVRILYVYECLRVCIFPCYVYICEYVCMYMFVMQEVNKDTGTYTEHASRKTTAAKDVMLPMQHTYTYTYVGDIYIGNMHAYLHLV